MAYSVWANTNTVYEDVWGGLRSLADELWAIQLNECDYSPLLNKRRADDDTHHMVCRVITRKPIPVNQHNISSALLYKD